MKLQVPKGCGGLGYQGQEYDAVNGVVEVPDSATVFLEPGWDCTQIFDKEAPAKGPVLEKKR